MTFLFIVTGNIAVIFIPVIGHALDDEHRTRRLLQHIMGNRADEHAAECAKAARAHDNEVAFFFFGDFADFLAGIADFDARPRLDFRRHYVHEVRKILIR